MWARGASANQRRERWPEKGVQARGASANQRRERKVEEEGA